MDASADDRLAAALARRRARAAVDLDVDGRWPRRAGNAAPLAPTQFGLWYAHRRDPTDAAHHRTTVVRIEGPLDTERLAGALRTVVARHEPLRTLFRIAAGTGDPEQVVGDASPPLTVIDGRTDPAAVARVVATADRTAFSLVDTPPVAITLVRTGADDHVLVLACSHLVFDGPSEAPFVTDLAAAYAGEAMPALAVRYRDWAAARAAEAASDAARADREWWVAHLLPPLPPRRRAVAWEEAEPVAEAAQVLDRLTSDLLRALARTERVTPFSVLLTALLAALADAAGLTELLVDVPVSARHDAELDGLVGCFVEILPLRLTVLPDTPGRAAIRAVAHDVVAALARRRAAVGDVVGELRRRTGRVEPLEGGVSAQWRRGGETRAHGAGVDFTAVPRPPTGAGLHLRADDDGTTITLRLGTGCGPIDATAALAAIGTALARLVREPDAPFASRRAEPMRATLDGAIEGPDGAILAGDALDARVGRVAAGLAGLGVRSGAVVAVTADGVDGIVAMHAAWRLGAVCMPIDRNSPPRYRERLLALAAPAHVADDLTATAMAMTSGAATPCPAVLVDPCAPAQLFFTSGSTGEPSGVVVSRAAIDAYVSAARETYGFRRDDRVALVFSLAFDGSLFTTAAALSAGATVVVPPSGFTGSARRLLAECARLRITVLDLPTALWHEVVQQMVAGGLTVPDSLRLVVVGGQAVRGELVEDWARVAPDVPLVNAYGPTETTVDVVTATLTPASVRDGVPIGRPHRGVRVAVVDGTGRPVVAGDEGELWVAGAQLALGYLGDAERTADRFVTGRGALSGVRWYRTGDRVVERADGQLEFRGRLDAQLKVRGFRVEPAEIERALLDDATVGDAVVVARDGRLVAHLVAAPAATVDPARVRAGVADRLPTHLVPDRVVVHATLPRTAGGKADRLALAGAADPGAGAGASTSAGAPGSAPSPDTVDDRWLALWRAALELPALGAHDDIVAAGATSLHVVRLVGAIERHVGHEVPLAHILEHRSAARSRAALATRTTSGVVPLTPPAAGPVLFLLPPGGAELLAYHEVAGHFAGERRVCTFDLPGLDGTTAPLRTLAGAVAWHVDRIRATQPHGPYLLAGYSLGAFLALECARDLRATGEAVALVAMIDPNVRDRHRDLRAWFRGDHSQPLTAVLHAGVVRRRDGLRARMLARRWEHARRPAEQSFDLVRHHLGRIHCEWRPRRYDGRVVVFRAIGTPTRPIPRRDPDPMHGVGADVQVVPVPGTHTKVDSVLTGEHAAVLAAALRAAIGRVA